MINMATHRNVLRLRGFCMTHSERLFVYPYMVNRSVASHLRGSIFNNFLPFSYCNNPRIIHRDVKAANILLDDEFEAVVGDFGLAKLMDYNDTYITTDVCGTTGHIALEYLYTRICSEKTDVFAYGIMLLL